MPATELIHDPDRHRIEFATTDPDRAHAYLSTAFGDITRISGGRAGYRCRHVRLGPGPFHVDTLEHPMTGDYRVDPLPVLAVTRVRRGTRINLDRDDRCGPGDLTVYGQPGEAFRVRLVDCVTNPVLIPTTAAAEVARNRPDDDLGLLRFTSTRPTDPAAARRWLRVAAYVADSLRATPEVMAEPLLAGTTTRLLAATLLTTFPNTWITEAHPRDRTDATPRALSRAVAFIDGNADRDITAVDIARAARISVRAVALAFFRHLATTPMAHLRRVRLACARDQLLAAEPGDGSTMPGIAARWGYADIGRFTTDYRHAYGQPPRHAGGTTARPHDR
ncbi:AraC family transcriptional regulator [Krasilnikovia sp. MM14-A1004]|uniref:AraC family transcriptional regulator n=1 Tax=Krasilnikovia sp. MM14-A1004 TaxID=3373541 RepID=UPI00399D3222